MTQENREAAAAAIVEGERAVSNLAELHGRLEPCFGRAEPFAQARNYIAALMSDLPRKDGWTIAEHAGDSTPNRTQRLLNHAVWDTEKATSVVRAFVAGHLEDEELVVGALDESGQQKQGGATAAVKRQYMGWNLFSGWITCCWRSPTGNMVVPQPVPTTPPGTARSQQPRVARIKEKRECVASRAKDRARGRISRTRASPPNRVRSVVTEERGRI
ncbi:transposase [Amycolatopsis sp. NPDC051061]|uniref:transposase n=1 Tax=Amycolatopsis sp. NPDC051061 TaxID=3155042 RepID=UPI0034380700